ncbi:Uncharacterised protein [Klebsiella variicola]|nr:hypothetical protein AE36_03543 [Klebsiella variicola]SBI80053.1 Uncharacterised protein [Klebsiella pneumoniae]SXG45102.1 Uncharacterised protein [Klebsiella variicola]
MPLHSTLTSVTVGFTYTITITLCKSSLWAFMTHSPCLTIRKSRQINPRLPCTS